MDRAKVASRIMDLCMLGGAVCACWAAWMLHPVAGMAVVSVMLFVIAVIIHNALEQHRKDKEHGQA